jgi:hypothetical protein
MAIHLMQHSTALVANNSHAETVTNLMKKVTAYYSQSTLKIVLTRNFIWGSMNRKQHKRQSKGK